MGDIKDEYKKLLASGMFWELFPYLTGDWEHDKEMFIELNKDKIV